MPLQNNKVDQIGFKAKIKRWGGEIGTCTNVYKPYASCGPTSDCHQITFLAIRRAARILIIYLRHIYYLRITRPSCLLGEERRPDSRTLKRQKSSLDLLVLERSRSRFFENNGLITTGYEVRMGCFPHCVYLLWNDLICLLYTLIVSSSFIRAYGMALTEQIYNTPYWPVLLNHNSNVAPKPTGLKR